MNYKPPIDAYVSQVTGNAAPGMRLGVRAAVFGLAYFLAQEIAFRFPDASRVLMAIWPASGIGLAVLLLSPRRQWGVLAGVLFVAGNVADLSVGRPILASAAFMTANVLESLGCAWLVSRWCGGQVRFDRVLEVVALMAGATLVNAGSAFLGAAIAATAAAAPFWPAYQSWWVSNGLGLLLVTPLIVAWCRPSPGSRFPGRGRVAEAAVLAVAAAGLSAFAFGPASAIPSTLGQPYTLAEPYTLVIVLCWAALRLGVRGTAVVLALMAGIVVGYTATGHSGFPLGGEDPTHRLLLVQLFLGVCGCFALLLAASQVERMGAQEGLQESEERYKALFDRSLDCVFLTDFKGQFLDANRAALDLLGYRREDIATVTFASLLTEDQSPLAIRTVEEIKATGRQGQPTEFRLRRKDGGHIWVETQSSLIYRDGKPFAIQGIARDLSARKQAEAALGFASRRLELIARMTDTVIGISTTAEVAQRLAAQVRECFEVDACVIRILESDQLALIGAQGVPAAELPARLPVFGLAQEVLVTCKPVVVPDVHTHPLTQALASPALGTFSFVSYAGVPLIAEGQTVGILAIYAKREPRQFAAVDIEHLQIVANHVAASLFNEQLFKTVQAQKRQLENVITERKRAEAELRDSTERLHLAQRAARFGIWDYDVKTRRTVWTTEQEALFGFAPGTFDGAPNAFEQLVHPDDRPRLAQAIAQAMQTGDLDVEFRATRGDGELRWYAGHGQTYRDAAGQPARMIGINIDITEKRQLEAQFLRSQRMEGIGALAGGIAHDLNNILAPMLMVGPLLRETVSDPEARQMIDTLEGCAQRGADIIKQLLTFARGQPGARAPLPVRHLLNEMHKLIRETFPRNIQSAVVVPKELWPILGDATQIHQALMNLCVNARDALPEGGTLTLAAENVTLDKAFVALEPEAKPGNYVRVSVTDTGTGIPPELVDRIFDPFFTTKEIGKGTGLGLATVLGIVRGHGGFVRVSSQVGRGTTFELHLPASPEAKAAREAGPEARPPRGQGELILVVDDEAAVREITRRTLEKYGYRVIDAREGAEALALFGQHPEVRAVITDMMMPGMDGTKLVQALRERDACLPILGMTGLAERAGVKGLEMLNLPVVLNKPFAGASLLAAMSQVLGQSRPNPEEGPGEREAPIIRALKDDNGTAGTPPPATSVQTAPVQTLLPLL